MNQYKYCLFYLQTIVWRASPTDRLLDSGSGGSSRGGSTPRLGMNFFCGMLYVSHLHKFQYVAMPQHKQTKTSFQLSNWSIQQLLHLYKRIGNVAKLIGMSGEKNKPLLCLSCFESKFCVLCSRPDLCMVSLILPKTFGFVQSFCQRITSPLPDTDPSEQYKY